jgi:hypothetical protein
MVKLVVLSSKHHGFEEPWRFGNSPFASFDFAFLDVHVDVAVSLDAGYVVDFEV